MIDLACVAARDAGVNLFLGEFGRESVFVRPVRDKVPRPIEGQGLCWFVAQEFAVMYNGDVYPCFYVTDHRFGNIREQSMREIWNSPAAQRLRAAHFARRGTLFCRGCAHAPHLPAARGGAAAELVKLLRRVVLHLSRRRSHAASRWPRPPERPSRA